MLIYEAINYGTKNNIEVRDVKELLKYILNKDDVFLTIHNNDYSLSVEETQRLMNACNELIEGKPLQYITHKQYFFGEEFYVDENVLIPQPDTEVLVNETIKVIEKTSNFKINNCDKNSIINADNDKENLDNNRTNISNLDTNINNNNVNLNSGDNKAYSDLKKNVKVLDLCTGSGAIAICLKKRFGDSIAITASDISDRAIDVAKKNAEKILKNNDIIFIQSDMFKNLNEKFDVIVSNPPYIKTQEITNLAKDVQNEPHIALDGGDGGLDFYRIIKHEASEHLNDNGVLLLEIGYDQKDDIEKIFENCECLKDFAGNNRVAITTKSKL